jgi:16S rRNA (guanine527-N7)-methyltransferase
MEIDSPEWAHLIIDGAKALGLEVRPEHTRLFARHATELLKWNAVTNLTAITQPEAMALNHYLDSLAPAGLIAPGSALLDVGSGGGFPGLPLHVVIDRLQTTLIDAARKKVSFLRHVLRQMALPGIEARHLRVEDLGREAGGRRAYDVIASRAVSALAPFVRTVWPLLRPNGRVLALKGTISPAEMLALRDLVASGDLGDGVTLDPIGYSLPGLKSGRIILRVSRAA